MELQKPSGNLRQDMWLAWQAGKSWAEERQALRDQELEAITSEIELLQQDLKSC